MKCLIVDDSALTRRILANSLKGLGFTTTLEAADAAAAISQCTPDVDLVITDWNMPGMPGVELVRALRADPAHTKLTILVVSARNVEQDRTEAAAAGANGYVVKPFTPEVLRRRIEAMLPRPAAAPAAPAVDGEAAPQAEGPADATGTDG